MGFNESFMIGCRDLLDITILLLHEPGVSWNYNLVITQTDSFNYILLNSSHLLAARCLIFIDIFVDRRVYINTYLGINIYI